ncbi:YscQ/HrcQ family type III secretion apparatus protein [Rhizobium sp. M10]|uniref:type III secretion system cytoplasmic ring protein SctQ n=1 Tax=Rhizobium sp. M10 TaxID=1324586 RepID=UPI000BE7BDD7|nr:type III secretion system cytoplasmic ring protein SctQ [Rhizobium sp. M10]PDT34764.1 YscQ/HrcQ family type III secretion apparatus protein [Rhizobium sp. M10]
MNMFVPPQNSISAAPRSLSRSSLPAREPWKFPFRGGSITIRPLAADIAAGRIGEPVQIRAAVAGRQILLIAPAATVQLLAERLEPLLAWEKLPPAARAAALEQLLADVFETVEDKAGAPISLTEIGAAPEPTFAGNFGFELGWNGITIPLCGRFDGEHLARLAQWASLLPRRTMPDLTAPVCLRRGYAVLSVRELRSLRTGDGIVIDLAAGETIVAVTAERYLAACTRSEKGVVLSSPLLASPNGPMRHFMTNETVDGQLQGEPRPSAIDDIPVKLVFDAGRIELPLRELETIGEGHVFALDRPMSNAVEIIAQGRIIGRGEIISVDGLSAVRVTALHD